MENNISPYNVLVADAELDKPVTKESSYIHKNRSLIPVLLSVSALRNAIGEITGYLGIARNISEQKIAEQQLKDSQHLFQNMAANVPGMIFQYYVKPDNTTGFLFVSNACKDIFEVNPEDIVSGKYRLLDFLLPEEREPYFNAILNSAKTLNKLTYEAAISTHSKTVKWLKVTAQPEKLNDGTIIFNGVLIDISDRKAAEVDLKKSQERYEIAVQGANDGLWDWDLISNKVYFSSRWKSMLGYQEHEIENNLDAFTKLLHPDQVAGVFERVNEYIAGNVKNYEIEFQLLHKKGYYHWILARGAVLRNQNGKAYRFAGSHTDIMERKIQEEALLSSEARFRAMNDASPLGIFVTNPTGDCIYTNSAYQKITGFEATALLGDGWITAIHPDDKEMVAKKWYECTESNQTFESIHRFVKPDNTVVWTSVKAAEMRDDKKIIGYVGTVDDLTETKKAENEILQSTYMINNATDAIIGSDINFVITSFNSAAEKIYGFKKEEVIGKVAENILITEFISTTKRNFLVALKYQGVWSGEVLQTRKDKKIIPVLSSLSINKDNEGNVIGYLAVNRDISERKKREDIISKLNIELEQNLNQLELSNRELEAFSYSISHDLRAPLRAIDGFTQILKEDYIEKMDDEAQRLMNVIMNNAKKMGQLIDDLLDFSRLSKKEIIKVSIDMNQMVAIVLEDLKSNFHDLHPEIKINSLPAALGDSSTLKQVWVNLISNAIKYSQNQKKSKIEIGFTEKENEIIYFVKDNGVGFNMKYYDKLFGVFQRLHSAEEFEGTGVGLAIVQRIILKNGGRVWADAEVNKGATFFFSLPK